MIMAKISLPFLKKQHESFSTRIFLLFNVFIIIISVSFTAFFFQQQRKSLKQGLTNEGVLLAKLLAYNSRLGVYVENGELLTDAVDGILRHKKVLFVSIHTLAGKPLTEQGQKPSAKQGKAAATDWQAAAERLGKNPAPLVVEGADTFEFLAPVVSSPAYASEEALIVDDSPFKPKERVIGFVRLILDKKSLDEQLQTLLLTSILLVLVFLVAGSIITYLLVKGITQPLNRLTTRVKALGTGGSFSKIPVETWDEIGNLAIAFNTMSESLQKRESEKQQLEEQLRHSQKMEAVGTLAGGVAHDFNNLLTAIIGFGNLLQMTLEEDTPPMTYTKQILLASDRAAVLTKRLLTFSRHQIINPSPMDINIIIRNLENILVRVISEEVEFKVELTEKKLTIMTDAGLIDQIIINLATNARDAMPNGGTLSIRTDIDVPDLESLQATEGGKPGQHALITVTDTGFGMDEKTRERIFDPFFTTKEVGKGTGLGLSMVYGLVKQHNGFIRVESTPGRGTTFQIYLPLIESQADEKNPGTLSFPMGNNETVLVAEDDRLVMGLAREILGKHGYRIVEAADGEEAVARFTEHADRIEMVLLDVIMPKKNGKEVFEEIKKLKPNIKTLFMSGYTNDIIAGKGIIEEGINLISKPVHPGELLHKIREVLQH